VSYAAASLALIVPIASTAALLNGKNQFEFSMGLAVLIAGLAVFLAAHVFVTFRGPRAAAMVRLGYGYRALFAIVALAGLALIVWGFALYRATGWIQIWTPPAFMRHITIGLMLPAVILVTAAYLPSHIRTWTKHPMLAAIKLWAFAHLLANGDLGSILLFGSFLGWAVYARIAAKRRNDVPPPAPAGWTNDIIAVLLGIVIYLALGYVFHPIVIGVPVFGR
jgi:uncharacterized protein with PQ loop repeat